VNPGWRERVRSRLFRLDANSFRHDNTTCTNIAAKPRTASSPSRVLYSEPPGQWPFTIVPDHCRVRATVHKQGTHDGDIASGHGVSQGLALQRGRIRSAIREQYVHDVFVT
jgi:hypothetical protein